MIVMSRTLSAALVIDALVSGVAAAVFIAGSFVLAGFLGLPPALMLWAGIAIVPWVAGLLLISRQSRVSRTLIWTIIVANLAWVAASLYVAFGPAIAPTLAGKVFVVAQAVAVALFAELQALGLKRSTLAA